MNSLFENRNIDPNAEERLAQFRCSECGYVGSHKQYPLCSKRVG
jgi:hypothetical protein